MAKVKQKKITKGKSPVKVAVKKTTKAVTKAAPKANLTKKPAKAAKAAPPKKAKAKAKASKISANKKKVVSTSKAKPTKAKIATIPKAAASQTKIIAKAVSVPQITPLDDRVVIAVPRETESKSAGGLILLSPVENEGLLKGQVLRVGRGHRDKKGRIKPITLKTGDWVLLNSFSGTEVHVDQQNKILIVREADVLGLAGE